MHFPIPDYAIWIPEPLYRIFPYIVLWIGLICTFAVEGVLAMGLSGALVGYGCRRWQQRRAYWRTV